MTARVDPKRTLNALAFRQAGYFTANQARATGFSYQAQKYHSDRGNWTKIDRGLFRLPGWPQDPADIYSRWCVWSEGKGVISHHSAASFHGLGNPVSGKMHMIMPPGSSSRNSQVVLHPAILTPIEVVISGPIMVTTPTRTLIDLARSRFPEDDLKIAVRCAIEAAGTDPAVLRSSAEVFGERVARRLLEALASLDLTPRKFP